MKKLSKKGFSLVEAIVSIFILSIVVVTVVGTIGLAQGSISESSVKDSLASDAQAVMDSLIQGLSTTEAIDDTTTLSNECGAVYVAPAEDMEYTLGEKLFTFEPSEDGMGYKITVCVFTESGKNSATLYGYTSIYGDSFKRKNSE